MQSGRTAVLNSAPPPLDILTQNPKDCFTEMMSCTLNTEITVTDPNLLGCNIMVTGTQAPPIQRTVLPPTSDKA